jgi:hypothetical protein
MPGNLEMAERALRSVPGPCFATDPALGFASGGIIRTEAALATLAANCSSIDYLKILSCNDCTQSTWAKVQLKAITGYSATGAKSSLAIGFMPQISDTAGLAQVAGKLKGCSEVYGMVALESLKGFEGIDSIGQCLEVDSKEHLGVSIRVSQCSKLVSATALENAQYEGALWLQGNPNLKCVPASWPQYDYEGQLIRQGDCSPPTPQAQETLSLSDIIGIAVGIIGAVTAVLGVYYARKSAATTGSADERYVELS